MSTAPAATGRLALVAMAAVGCATLAAAWWCPVSDADLLAAGSVDPVPVASMVLRAAVGLTGAYLLVTTLLAVVARVTAASHLSRWITRASLPCLRPLVRAAIGAGTVITLAGGVPAGATPAPRDVAVAASERPPTMAVEVLAAPADPPVVMSEIPEAATTPRAPEQPGDGTLAGAETAGTVPTRWLIEPGDHLWRVAEQTLARAWGRSPAASEVAPYWHELVERNRMHLVIRDDPDLVFPGQEFDLPPVPSR